MTTPPALGFAPLRSPARPGGGLAPETGEPGYRADFAALVPLVEPVSAGLVPVAPTLVRRVNLAGPLVSPVVSAVRSGHLVTRGSGPARTVAGRARLVLDLEWGPLTRAQRDTLVNFLYSESGAGSGLRGFEIELDGEGVSPPARLRVIEIGGAAIERLEPGTSLDADAGRYWIGPVRVVEEVT